MHETSFHWLGEWQMMKKFVVALVVLAACGTAGCSSARWQDSAVTDDGKVIVNLEQQMKEGRAVDQGYRHPFDIDGRTLGWLLDDLTYMAEPMIMGDPKETPVFQQEEIQRLAPAIAQALQRATSAQRVRFVSFNQGVDFLFKKPRKTEGVMFVDANGRLHIAFSWINQQLNVEGEPKSTRGRYRIDPLQIRDLDTPIVAAKPYIRHYRFGDGGIAPQRVVVNVDHLVQAARRQAPEKTVEFSVPEKGEAAAPPGSGKMMQKHRRTAPPGPAADWETRKERIRSRLEYLKELYEDGLISESEYKAERQQVLDDLQ
jgi:hypothetical protein